MSTNTKQSRKRLTISNEIKKNQEELEDSTHENSTIAEEVCDLIDNKDSNSIIFLSEIKLKSPEELLIMADSLGVEDAESMYRQDLVFAILQRVAEQGGVMVGEGVLEILSDGFGFLRSHQANYMPGPDDIYVSPNQIRKNALRTGDTINGTVREPKKGER